MCGPATEAQVKELMPHRGLEQNLPETPCRHEGQDVLRRKQSLELEHAHWTHPWSSEASRPLSAFPSVLQAAQAGFLSLTVKGSFG